MTSHVFHRHTKFAGPVAARGDGPYITDKTGRRWFDASSGAAVSCLGHSHPDVVAAIKTQAEAIAYAHTGFFTNEPMEALADILVDRAPGDINRVYFVSGGSEAMEASILLARQYFLEKGEPKRTRVIARRQGYHGNTLGALSASGHTIRRTRYEPLLADMSLIAPCYAYRNQRADETAEEYGLRVADELEQEILRLGPDTVMAFLAETVVGSSMGAVPPVPGYFKRIREICDRYGVLLILDEVMCGMGRTGTTFACEQDGIVPDMVAIAKALGGGYQPIAALMVSGRIFDAIRDGAGFFQHGLTYMGHALACAAALAVQQVIVRDNLVARSAALGATFRAQLEDAFKDHPHVGDIRGRGLMLGLEFVSDRDTKEPFRPTAGLSGRIKDAAFANGVICFPHSGTADGLAGDHVLLAPPFISTEEQLADVAAAMRRSVDSAVAGIMAPA